jgi:hypothetical protein
VLAYLKAHEFSAIEASYTYQGAFASGTYEKEGKKKQINLTAHEFSAIEAGYTYQGPFANGTHGGGGEERKKLVKFT